MTTACRCVRCQVSRVLCMYLYVHLWVSYLLISLHVAAQTRRFFPFQTRTKGVSRARAIVARLVGLTHSLSSYTLANATAATAAAAATAVTAVMPWLQGHLGEGAKRPSVRLQEARRVLRGQAAGVHPSPQGPLQEGLQPQLRPERGD